LSRPTAVPTAVPGVPASRYRDPKSEGRNPREGRRPRSETRTGRRKLQILFLLAQGYNGTAQPSRRPRPVNTGDSAIFEASHKPSHSRPGRPGVPGVPLRTRGQRAEAPRGPKPEGRNPREGRNPKPEPCSARREESRACPRVNAKSQSRKVANRKPEAGNHSCSLISLATPITEKGLPKELTAAAMNPYYPGTDASPANG